MATERTTGGLYIGLISGTSIDGIDSALVRLSDHGTIVETLATETQPISANMAEQIRKLGPHSALHKICEIDYCLADAFSTAASKMLEKAPNDEPVKAIGCHGQTIWHNSQYLPPVSIQIGDANRIAAQTGVQIVTDFRRRDIAEGGQGAPLAPGFHAHCLTSQEGANVILNLGGIANVTLLPPKTIQGPPAAPSGFDTGPANTLLDAWSRENLRQCFDDGGRWAATGNADWELLDTLRKDPYFACPPPKSTGPEYFSLDWLTNQLPATIAPEDVQATLVELTAVTVADSLNTWGCSDTKRILVCGGGVHNQTLLARLQQRCYPATVDTTLAIGIDPDYVEALAFAWLAWAHLNGFPGNLPTVTGASREAVLGCLYSA